MEDFYLPLKWSLLRYAPVHSALRQKAEKKTTLTGIINHTRIWIISTIKQKLSYEHSDIFMLNAHFAHAHFHTSKKTRADRI